MDPRTDQAGIVLTREEAVFAVACDEAAEYIQRLERVTGSNSTGNRILERVGLVIDDEQDEVLLDDIQTARLWNIVFWVAGLHLASYKNASTEFEEICENNDLTLQAVQDMLEGIDQTLGVEGSRAATATAFASTIRFNHNLSRNTVMMLDRS